MAPSAIRDDLETGSQLPVSPICQIVTPVGMMGYGFNEKWTEETLKVFSRHPTPTAIILDSGSTDSGPSKLALGTTTCPRSSYERDFRKLLDLSIRYKAPILMSSAGGDGSDEHVDLFLEIIREIADEKPNHHWSLKTISIYSQVEKSLVKQRLSCGKITGCGPSVPTLTPEIIDQSPRIVAQIGPEPFLDAMNAHPDFNVLIGGRAYDVAPFVAWAVYHSLSPKQRHISRMSPEALGSITHMGKILECGGLCATPKGLGAAATINSDFSVDIKPIDPSAKCIPLSVAAHTLYEKTRPDILHGPGGYLDVSSAKYTQLEDGRTTRVSGSVFHLSRRETSSYTVKLEGARVAGFRTLMMGSFGDPILIPQIHEFLDGAKAFARSQHCHIEEDYDIGFHVYGLNGDTVSKIKPNPIFVVVETIAQTQDVATSLASTIRTHFAHGAYRGQKATSGNFGMGIGGKFELETGPCAEFSLYHLMSLLDGEEHGTATSSNESSALFRWNCTGIGRGSYQDFTTHLLVDGQAPEPYLRPMDPPSAPTKPTQSSACGQSLGDIAKVIRSKNSGPFEVTLDVIFDDPTVYDAVKSSAILTREVIGELYDITPEEVIWSGFFDVAMAYKATIPRRRNGKPSCSGGYMENDVHGSQQYSPLVNIPLPDSLLQELCKAP